MVIDSNNISSSSGGVRTRLESRNSDATAPKEKSAVASVATGKAEVSLSSEAQLLSRMDSKLEETPDVNSERVAAIKKAIADGTFNINPESIAERMLDQDDLF